MNEAAMMHGRDYAGENVAGWLVSEKFNGCRIYWDGFRLWTRSGNIVKAPAWFTAGLPTGTPLDGEIWAGRAGFKAADAAVRFARFDSSIRFMVFDAPSAAGTWAERMAFARELLAGNLTAQAVEFSPVFSSADLSARLTEVQSGGGEGLMVRHPASVGYRAARTSEILKVKRWRSWWPAFAGEQVAA